MREPMPATRHLSVFETFREGWELTKGSKWAIWAPMLVWIGLIFAFTFSSAGLMAYLKNQGTAETPSHLGIVGVIVAIVGILFMIFISLALLAGIYKVAITRARGLPVSGGTGFHSFSRVFPLLFATILVAIIAELPQIILLIASHFTGIKTFSQETTLIIMLVQFIYGIIVGAFMYLALLYAVDQNNNPFKAIGNSFRATRGHWWKIIGIILIMYLIMLVFYAPVVLGKYLQSMPLQFIGLGILLVALVWLLPFFFLVQGAVYHKLAD